VPRFWLDERASFFGFDDAYIWRLEIERLRLLYATLDGFGRRLFRQRDGRELFANLECELLERRSFKTQAAARMAVFDFIEGWYNPHRRHSALGYQSPINYERCYEDDANQTLRGAAATRTAGPPKNLAAGALHGVAAADPKPLSFPAPPSEHHATCQTRRLVLLRMASSGLALSPMEKRIRAIGDRSLRHALCCRQRHLRRPHGKGSVSHAFTIVASEFSRLPRSTGSRW
jgi:Integrase core domain